MSKPAVRSAHHDQPQTSKRSHTALVMPNLSYLLLQRHPVMLAFCLCTHRIAPPKRARRVCVGLVAAALQRRMQLRLGRAALCHRLRQRGLHLLHARAQCLRMERTSMHGGERAA